MIIAIYSDMHSTVSAFEAMQADAEAANAEQFWNLGDTAGYLHEYVQLIRKVRRLERQYPGSLSLLGNHDAGILNRYLFDSDQKTIVKLPEGEKNIRLGERFNEQAYTIIKNQRQRLEKPAFRKEYNWLDDCHLRQQPLPGYYLAHGSYARDDDADVVWKYGAKNFATVKREFEQMQAWADGEREDMSTFRFLALGHYHVPGVWRWNRTEDKIEEYDPLQSPEMWEQPTVFEGLAKNPIIISPGSAALPRPLPRRTNKAAYVLMRVDESNLDRVEICFRENMYDWTTYRDTLSELGYPLIDTIIENLELCKRPQTTTPRPVCFGDEKE